MRRLALIAAAALGASAALAPLATAAPAAARAERSGDLLTRGPLPPRPEISARGPVVAVGTRLSARAGGWRSLARTGARFAWQMRAPGGTWSDIDGAGAAALTVPEAALGRQIRVVVRGGGLAAAPGRPPVADGDAGQRTSTPVTVRAPQAPRAVTPPSVAGSGVAGSRLVVDVGVWRADPRPVLEVAWLRDGDPIPDADGRAYTPTAADAGHALSAVVAARNAGGASQAASEPLTIRSAGPVPAAPRAATRRVDARPARAHRARSRTAAAAPRVVSGPVVQGPVVVGGTLTSIPGVYRGSPRPKVVAYQWQRSSAGGRAWSAIPGGSGPTLALDPALLGDVIRLVETVRNPSGEAVARSNATKVVTARAPESTGAPVVSGTAAAGATLTASGGTWAGAPAPALAFQWQSSPDGGTWADLPGADTPHLVVGLDEVGLRLRVLVTASNPGGTALAASAPTAAVPAVAPVSTSPPSVSGAPAVGSSLTVAPGGWSGDPAPGTSVQWYTAPEASGPWSPLPGAAATTLVVPPAAAGLYLQAVVSATNPGGTATASSAAVGPVAADPPVPSALPVVAASPATTPAPGGAVAVPGASAPYLDLLTATGGTWSQDPATTTFQWIFQAPNGGGYTPIPGATGATYQPSCAQLGGSVTVAVTAAGGGGATTVVAPGAVQVGDPDSDGDGLTDCTEVEGAPVTVISGDDLSSTTTTVGSSPLLVDTDADGLGDLSESDAGSDPTSPDSDGDGLTYTPGAADGEVACGQDAGAGPCSSDWTEVNVYASRPTDADSDGDATQTAGGTTTVFPALFDGTEVARWGTSPTLADTDGDAGFSFAQGALTDTTEVLVGNGAPGSAYNPLVAQVPRYAMQISDAVDFGLQYTVTTQVSTQQQQVQSSVSTDSSQQRTGTDSTTTSELNWNIKANVAKGEKGVNFGLDGNVGGRYATAVTTFNDDTTTAQLQQTAQQILTQSRTNTVAYAADSSVSTTVTVTNTGQVSFALQDPVFLLQVPDPSAAGQQMTLATLTPSSGTTTSCPGGGASNCTATLQPGQPAVIAIADTDVPTQQLLEYMASPGSLTITLAAANFINGEGSGTAAGQPFSGSVGQAVNAQTANVVVDPGSLGTGPLSLEVATTVGRDATGQATGVPFLQALSDAGVGVTTGEADGIAIATQVDIPGQGPVPPQPVDPGAITPQGGLWLLAGATTGGSAPTGTADVDVAVLRQGQTVLLQFGRDGDADGLLDAAEQILGTDPAEPDTDGDGAAQACGATDDGCLNGTSYASDYFEVMVGWTVPLTVGTKASYATLSNPLSCDADADGSPDGPGPGIPGAACPDGLGPESARDPDAAGLGTDPGAPDTNLDGVVDGAQKWPAVVQPCPAGTSCLPPTPFGAGQGGASWTPFPGGPAGNGANSFAVLPPPALAGADPADDEAAILVPGFSSSALDLFTIDGTPAGPAQALTPPAATAIATAPDGSYWIAAPSQFGGDTTQVVNVTTSGTATPYAFPPFPGALTTGQCGDADAGYRVVDLAVDSQGELVALVQLADSESDGFTGLRVVRWIPGDSTGDVFVADDPNDSGCDVGYDDNTAIAAVPDDGGTLDGGVIVVAPAPESEGQAQLSATVLDQDLTAGTSWLVSEPEDQSPSGWGQFAGVSVDPQGYVYLGVGWGQYGGDPDAGGEVLKYDLSGTLLTTVAASGSGTGQVSGNDWLGATAGCRLLVEDTWNQRFDLFAYPIGDTGDCPDAPAVPAAIAPPAIGGTPEAGAALSCTAGAWSGDPVVFAFQWSVAGQAVAGATQSSLTVPAGIAPGASITCTVTASNTQGSTSSTSAAVEVPES